MGSVYKRELKSYFSSMNGYVFIAMILVIVGIFAAIINFYMGSSQFEYSLESGKFLFLLVIPILTMRSFAEEKRNKTEQLLFSLPISSMQIVLGKYLAMLTVFAIPCAFMCIYPVIIGIYGQVAYMAAFCSIFGFFIIGAGLIAIGMFISTLTESQIISAVLTFLAAVICLYINLIGSLIPSDALATLISFMVIAVVIAIIIYVITKSYLTATVVLFILVASMLVPYYFFQSSFAGLIQKVLSTLAIANMADSMFSGIFDLTSVLYYLSVVIIFCFLSYQSLEKRRWS